MILRIILLIVLIYFGGKLIKDLLNPAQKKNIVNRNPKDKKPIDLSKYDVEDADFEEIDE